MRFLSGFQNKIEPLTPGTYLVFATHLPGYDAESWKDELKPHVASAVRVEVKDGVSQTISIRPLDLILNPAH